MSTIIDINLGVIPNDGSGDPLRQGGADINTNFDNLNADKLETGGYVGTAQDIVDLIETDNLPFKYFRARVAMDFSTSDPFDVTISNIRSSMVGEITVTRVAVGQYRVLSTDFDFGNRCDVFIEPNSNFIYRISSKTTSSFNINIMDTDYNNVDQQFNGQLVIRTWI